MEKRGIGLIGRRKREVKIKWKECWLWDYKTWWDIRQFHQSSTFQIVEKNSWMKLITNMHLSLAYGLYVPSDFFWGAKICNGKFHIFFILLLMIPIFNSILLWMVSIWKMGKKKIIPYWLTYFFEWDSNPNMRFTLLG